VTCVTVLCVVLVCRGVREAEAGGAVLRLLARARKERALEREREGPSATLPQEKLWGLG